MDKQWKRITSGITLDSEISKSVYGKTVKYVGVGVCMYLTLAVSPQVMDLKWGGIHSFIHSFIYSYILII